MLGSSKSQLLVTYPRPVRYKYTPLRLQEGAVGGARGPKWKGYRGP